MGGILQGIPDPHGEILNLEDLIEKNLKKQKMNYRGNLESDF